MNFQTENEIFVRGGIELQAIVRGGMELQARMKMVSLFFFIRSSENDFFRSPGPLGKHKDTTTLTDKSQKLKTPLEQSQPAPSQRGRVFKVFAVPLSLGPGKTNKQENT